MEFILKDAPGTQYGSDKAVVANALADQEATLVYFDTEGQSFANRDRVAGLGMAVQDLYATESPVEGSSGYQNNGIRDAAYEEIFHLVHDAGIVTSLPAFHAEIIEAEQLATAAGLYRYDDPEGAPYEYVISCIDIYYGMWAHQTEGPSFGDEYDPWTPENLQTLDPACYGLVEKFFPPFLDLTVYLDESFADDTFELTFNEAKPYTLKSKFMKNVTLTGINLSNVLGNELDNVLTGNSSDNQLTGGSGDDTIDGGDGSDTAVFSGTSTEYTIITNDGESIITDNIAGRDGVDTIRNVELLHFSDTAISL